MVRCPRLTFIVASACVVLCVWPGRAGAADIHDLAGRVQAEWKVSSTRVEALPPRFLFDDESVKLRLPEQAGATCVTVGIIGARGMSFHVKAAGASPDDDGTDARASSVAGVLTLSRCDKATERIVLTNDAGRGTVEILVAFGGTTPPPLQSVLLERTGGTAMPPPDNGVVPALPPAEERARRADTRAAAESADILDHQVGMAEADGTGDVVVSLTPACHGLDVFADVGKRTRRLDLDAEVRDEDGTVLTRDRSEAADAHLFVCVGESTKASVQFVGAPPRAKVSVAHAVWPLAAALPAVWGAKPRARMAHALRTRHLPPPVDRPIYLAQGASGETAFTVPVLPGTCYVAVAAVTSGHPRGLGLRATVGRAESSDERAPGDESGAVAFCTTTERTARLGVDARGAGVMWGLSLFRVLVRRSVQ
jgi:hypothetical protein